MLWMALTMMTAAAPTDFEKSTQAWHVEREKALQAEEGWLTLVGLEWLAEGSSTAGSGPDVAVRLPEPAPSLAGTFTRRGKSVTFAPTGGPATTLKTDADGPPDVLTFGKLRVFAIVRGDKVGLRMKNPDAPARTGFHAIPTYPADAHWRIEATWEPTPGGTLPVHNVLGQIEQAPSPGVAVFTVDGKTFRLRPTLEDPEGPLFFVFGDETNRTDTYGAGRFLNAELPKDGKVILDFNRATNPPCAFTSFATCPLPPAGNRLALKVTAGEKRYGDH